MHLSNAFRATVLASFMLFVVSPSMGHAPACDVPVREYESILREVLSKHGRLVDLASIPAGVVSAVPTSSDPIVDRVEFLSAIPAREIRDLITAVNHLANCIHDSAHSHEQ